MAIQKTIELLITAQDNSTKIIAGLQSSIGALQKSISGLNNTFSSLGKVTATAGGVTQKASSQFSNTAKSLDALESSSGRATYSISSLFSQLLVTAGLLKTMLWPVSQAAEFEQAIAKVGFISQSTSDELQQLSDFAKTMGQTTLFSASQAAEGLQLLALAGLDVQQSVTALPAVLNAAVISNKSVAESAALVTNILYGFNLAAEDMSKVIDSLTYVTTTTKSTFDSLGSGMSYVAPVASSLGADFDELTAAMGLLNNAGIEGSRAGTTLRMALGRLENPSKAAKEVLDSLARSIGQTSIQTHDSEGNFIGLSNIIRQLEDAGMTAGEALKIFGQRAGPGMAALVNQGADALDNLTQGIKTSQGIADEYSTILKQTLSGSFTTLIGYVQTLGTTIGEHLTPALTWIVQETSGVVGAFTALVNALGPVSTVIITLVTSLGGAVAAFTALDLVIKAFTATTGGKLLVALGSNIKLFAQLILTGESLVVTYNAATGAIITQTTALKGANIATRIWEASLIGLKGALTFLQENWVTLALTAITITAYEIYEHFKSAREAADELRKSLKTQADTADDLIDRINDLSRKEKEGNDVSREKINLIQKLIDKFPELANRTDLTSLSIDELKSVMEEIKQTKLNDYINSNISTLNGFDEKLWELTQGGSFEALNQVLQEAGYGFDLMRDGSVAAKDVAPEVQAAIDQLASVVSTIQVAAKKAGFSTAEYSEILNSIPGITTEVLNALTDLYEKQDQGADSAKQLAREQANFFKEQYEGLVASIEQEEELFKSSIKNIESAVKEGLKNQRDAAIEIAQIKLEKYRQLLDAANNYYNQLATLQNTDSETFKEALQKKTEAEANYRAAQAELDAQVFAKKDALYEQDIAQYQEYLQESLAALQNQLDRGLITEQQYEDKVLQVKLSSYSQQLSAQEAHLRDLKKNRAEDYDAIKRAESEIAETKRQIEQAKTEYVKKQIADEKALHEAKLRTEKVLLDKQLYQVDREVQQEVLTVQEGNRKKAQLELEYLEKVKKLREEQLKQAKNEYGEDSDEYQKALQAKEEADLDYQKKYDELQDLITAKSDQTAEIEKKNSEDVKNTAIKNAEETYERKIALSKNFIDSVKSESLALEEIEQKLGAFATVANNTLSSATYSIYQNIGKASGAVIGELASQKRKILELADAVYQVSNKILDINSLSLEGARQEVRSLINEFENLKSTIESSLQATKDAIYELSNSLNDAATQWSNNYARAQDLVREAASLAAKGAYEQADSLYNKAVSILRGLAGEVKDANGNIVKSQEETTQSVIKLLKQIETAQQNIVGRINKNINTLGNSLADVFNKLKSLPNIQAPITTHNTPKFATGGLLGGKPHSQGGTLIEAEKGEYVIPKSSTEKIAREYGWSILELLRQGVVPKYALGGPVATEDDIDPEFLEALRRARKKESRPGDLAVIREGFKKLRQTKFQGRVEFTVPPEDKKEANAPSNIEAINRGGVAHFRPVEDSKDFILQEEDELRNLVPDIINFLHKKYLDLWRANKFGSRGRDKYYSAIARQLTSSKEVDSLYKKLAEIRNVSLVHSLSTFFEDYKSVINFIKSYDTYSDTDTLFPELYNGGFFQASQYVDDYDWVKKIDAKTRYATGGLLGGKPHSQGGTLIEAEKGEYILPKKATENIVRNKGWGFLEYLRKGFVPKFEFGGLVNSVNNIKYADGGIVSPPVNQTKGQSEEPTEVVQVNFNFGSKSIPGTFSKENATQLINELQYGMATAL